MHTRQFNYVAFMLCVHLIYKASAAKNEIVVAGVAREDGKSSMKSFSCDGKWGPHCDGCSVLRICADIELKTINCVTDAKLKYCNRNKCSNTPPEDRQCSTDGEITCTSEGFFPHPSNCTQYYYCDQQSSHPIHYDCPSHHVYSAQNLGCIRRKTARDCATLNCANTPLGNVIVYAAHPAYYGVCVGIENALMFKCEDDVNSEYDINAGACVLKCQSEGRMPNRNNCEKYYQCVREGGKLVAMLADCPPKYGFDEQKNACVKFSEKC